MIQRCFYFLSLVVFLFCGGVNCFTDEVFKEGKPLSKLELELASRLEVFENLYFDEDDTDFSYDDVLEDFTERRTFNIENYFWPKGVIPYVLDENYDPKGRLLIARALFEFQNKTCIQFSPRKGERDYIEIVLGKGCSSHVGRVGGPQIVVLGRGCYAKGVMMHELMHTLGFVHEQSRVDRDDYVTILWDNIQPGYEDNFRIYDWYPDRLLDVGYDYSSILHYGEFAFSKDPKIKATISPKQDFRIGQRKKLSAGDIQKINVAYGCHPRKEETGS